MRMMGKKKGPRCQYCQMPLVKDHWGGYKPYCCDCGKPTKR